MILDHPVSTVRIRGGNTAQVLQLSDEASPSPKTKQLTIIDLLLAQRSAHAPPLAWQMSCHPDFSSGFGAGNGSVLAYHAGFAQLAWAKP